MRTPASMGDVRILDLFAQDPQRSQAFSIDACGMLLDYSKNPISAETRRLLVALAEEAGVPAQIAAMFEGRRINVTEKRAVLHTALRNRSQRPVMVDGQDVMPGIRAVLERMRGMAERIRGGIARGCTGRPFTDIVNIGIGGSDLGPLMVTTALRPYGSPGLHAHFRLQCRRRTPGRHPRRPGSRDDPVHRLVEDLHDTGNLDQCALCARVVAY